jgi:glutathione S-transferase
MEHRFRLHVGWLESKMTTQKDARFLAGVITVASVMLAAWVTFAWYHPLTIAETEIVAQVTTR